MASPQRKLYVLLVAAFIVYYGWNIFAKLLPTLAHHLKKILPKSWSQKCSPLEASHNHVEDENQSDSEDDGGMYDHDTLGSSRDLQAHTTWRERAAATAAFAPSPSDDPDTDGVYMEPEPTWGEWIVKRREAIGFVGGAVRDIGIGFGTLAHGFTRGATAGVVGGIRDGMRSQATPAPLPVTRSIPLALPMPGDEESRALVAVSPATDSSGSSLLPYATAVGIGGAALYGAYRFGSREREKRRKKASFKSSLTLKRDDKHPPGPGQPPREG
jgi:hypothetical protein